MSADNWAVCPKCREKRDATYFAVQNDVSDCYGKVPQEEFLSRAKRAGIIHSVPESFREDYSIGLTEGFLWSSTYKGSCADCGYSFQIEVDVTLSDSPIIPFVRVNGVKVG